MPDDAQVNGQQKQFIDSLLETFKSVKTVRIVTLETKLEIRGRHSQSNKLEIEPTTGNVSTGLVTEIDMLEGDVRYMRTPSLSAPETDALKTVHEQNVQMARDIFKENLEYFGKVVGLSGS